jgi:hypothetical protein
MGGISHGTGKSACATHGLFMRAFSAASGFLSITVKQAQGIFDCRFPIAD